MKDDRKTMHDEYAYLSQKYDFDEDLENSIYDKMNKIDDEESLIEVNTPSKDSTQIVDSENNELTPTQVKYFQNSKIRDNQGNLLVCYHGSDYKDKIDTLDIIHSGYSRKMLFFSDSNDFAISFANRYGKGQVFKCYINIENPLIIDAHGASFNAILFNNELKSLDEIAELIKDKNYDGIIAKNVREYHEGRIVTDIITFQNNQIKLISNKNPTFSDNMNQ